MIEEILVTPGDVDRGYVEASNGQKVLIDGVAAGERLRLRWVRGRMVREEIPAPADESEEEREREAWEEYCRWVASLDRDRED